VKIKLTPYLKQEETAATQYSLDSYEQMSTFSRTLFEKLNDRIMNLGSNIKREFKKLYVTYKLDSNFVSIVILNKGLRIFVNMKYTEVVDLKGLVKDVSGIGHWASGDVELQMDSLAQINDIMVIIEQSFQKQEAE
jgi:predicted transport protein